MRVILSLFFSCLIVSCVYFQPSSIDVNYDERDTLYFTGRGAAAGIMMDSLLGGTGVAIGIAIDEGIAKDIYAVLLANNPKFSMNVLVEDVLHKKIKQGMNFDGVKSLIIDKYGFQSSSGDNVVSLLELRFVCRSGEFQIAKFAPDDNVDAIAFEQSKTDGRLVESKLRDATEKLLNIHTKPCN